MTSASTTPSKRQTELLEAAYAYVLEHGIAEMSLRPLATAIGSSPRVLVFLFGNKDGLVRALLTRARRDELALLDRISPDAVSLMAAVQEIWRWLAADEHRNLLRLWVEAYARSLVDPDGAWSGFAQDTVQDWLRLLAQCQPSDERDTADGRARRTAALAVLRGALLDLLATGERQRVDAAVRYQVRLLA